MAAWSHGQKEALKKIPFQRNLNCILLHKNKTKDILEVSKVIKNKNSGVGNETSKRKLIIFH